MTTRNQRLLLRRVSSVVLLLAFLTGIGGARHAAGQVSLSVTPAYAYITEQEPHGSFVLRNDGTERVEVVVSARYGVIESDAGGAATHVTLREGGLMGDLTRHLTVFPDRLIIEPGEERFVRYMVKSPEGLSHGGHIALMHYQMQERHSVRENQVPAIATGLNIVYNLVAPIVLVKGEGAALLSAEVLSFEGGSISLLMTNRGAFPFVGGITATTWREGEEVTLGRAESAIYTRRRVEIPLSRVPTGGKVLLQFDTSYGSIPSEVSRHFAVPAPIEIEL
ncbi:MAG: hypothetical protein ACE5G0_09280 [Rhodothermales bacterium]